MEFELKFSDCQFSAFKNNVPVTLAILRNISDKGPSTRDSPDKYQSDILLLINLGYHYFRL